MRAGTRESSLCCWHAIRIRRPSNWPKRAASPHNFIGFQVAKPLLERSFKETCGLEMRDVFINEEIATAGQCVGAVVRIAGNPENESPFPALSFRPVPNYSLRSGIGIAARGDVKC